MSSGVRIPPSPPFRLNYMKIDKQKKLADFTTIKLGGEAKEFVECKNVDEIKECLQYTKDKNVDVWILAGGSNTVFKDEGFDGLVIKMDLQGVEFSAQGGPASGGE